MRRVSGWIGLVVGAVACSQSGSGAVCGSVTVAGQCTGAVLEYCSLTTNQLVQVDCSQVVADGGAADTCQLIDASYGYDCAAPTGTNCLQVDASGNTAPGFCQGTGPACVFGAVGATCQTNLPACVSYDPDGGFVLAGAAPNTSTCTAQLLQLYCNESEPVAQDCGAIGGSCLALDAGGACVDLPLGQPCDGVEFVCAPLLTCADPDGGGLAYCG